LHDNRETSVAVKVGGQNPQWNKWDHERMGWALSVFDPAAP